MNIALKERDFGELMGLSFKLAVAHFGKLFVIMVVFGLPLLPLQLLMFPAGESLEIAGREENLGAAFQSLGYMMLFLLGSVIIWAFQQGACILVVSGSFTGKHLSLGRCLNESLRRFFALFKYSMGVGLIAGLGLLFFIVPGLIFLTRFYVGVPALIVEKISWTGAMSRSRELSTGEGWFVFAFFFLMLVIIASVSLLIGVIMELMPGPYYLVEILGFFILNIVSIVAVCAPVVMYFQLRVVKESFDVDALSALVDAIAERKEAHE